MPTNREPAQHQIRALAKLEEWWKSKSNAKADGYLSMPTGSGKTFTAVNFVVDQILAKRKGACVVWVAHNKFLLEQAEKEFNDLVIKKGIESQVSMARVTGTGEGSDANVIFAMLPTLARKDNKLISKIKRAGTVDLVIFDEFHRLAATTWRRVPKRFQNGRTRTLGLSATPFRKTPDKTEILRGLLSYLIYSVGYRELCQDGFLADMTLTRVKVPNSKGIPLTQRERSHLRQFNDLNPSLLEKVWKQVGRDQQIVDHYKSDPRRFNSTIVFCCSKAHAEALANRFSENKIHAEHLFGSSHDPANKRKLESFRNGDFPVITSVLLLTEGVDVPGCNTVILARPTQSPVLLSQMMGRAMRGPKAGGTPTCNIVDFVDNIQGLGEFTASHLAYVREKDEQIRDLIHRPPQPGSQGVSYPLLLRLHEFLNEVIRINGPGSTGRIIQEEIVGWFENWDSVLNIMTILLVPKGQSKIILKAMEEVQEKTNGFGNEEKVSEAQNIARRVYDSNALYDHGISEEDFVATISAYVKDPRATNFYPLKGEESILKDPANRQRMNEALKEIESELESKNIEEFRDPISLFRTAISGSS